MDEDLIRILYILHLAPKWNAGIVKVDNVITEIFIESDRLHWHWLFANQVSYNLSLLKKYLIGESKVNDIFYNIINNCYPEKSFRLLGGIMYWHK
mgnify:CR=1 FL=1